MKYFLDTEFLEGTQNKIIFGIKYGETKPTIDLISIGLVSEDERMYYAISKDFNLKEAWNRYDLVDDNSVGVRIGCLPNKRKVYWIRENVLKPIFVDLFIEDNTLNKAMCLEGHNRTAIEKKMTYNWLRNLIDKYGKSNKQIAEEIKEFISPIDARFDGHAGWYSTEDYLKINKPEFLAFYADYDWVVFCWLFGRMIDLPDGFPYYCIDLKQELDNLNLKTVSADDLLNPYWSDNIKNHPDYPKQENEHNALSDALWNFKLYKFLQNFK